MSGDELMIRFTHDNPMMEFYTEKVETSMLIDSHIEHERGCDKPVDFSNYLSDRHKVQCPLQTKPVEDQGEKQGTDKLVCGTTCDMSVSSNGMSTENSEGKGDDTSSVLNTSDVVKQGSFEKSKPISEENVPLDNAFDETSKSLLANHELNQKQHDQKLLAVTESNFKPEDTEINTDVSSEREMSFPRGRPRKEKQVIKCEYCGRPFNHASAYVIHRRVHTGEKPFSCQICSRAFAQLSNLRSHMKVHNAPKILIQHPTRFQNKSTISKSMSQNLVVVSTGFKNDSLSRNSGPFHRSRKPVPCPICGKIFPYKSVLKIHLRIHSGEKPYSCKVCGKAFTQACTVRVHERVHWSIKPFLCSKCGKGFSQIGTLKAHTCGGKRHIHATLKEMELAGVVTFRCHLCKKCFSTREEYDPHLQSHTDGQRYSCDRCGQKYSLRSELDTHLKYCFSMWLAKTKSYSRQSTLKLQTKHVLSTKTVQSVQPNATVTPVKSPKPSSPELLPHKPPKTPPSDSPQPQKRKKYPSLLTCPSEVIATSVYDPENNLSNCQPFKTSYFVSQLNSLDEKSDPRKYLCPRCGRLFRHVGRLRAHMLTHTRGKSFTCGDCGRILENWSKFWFHQRVHKQRRGRFFCPKCGQGFRFASVYMEHLQQHPELNAYFCPFCPHTFANAKSLKNHQQEWHRSSMPHICDICGKGFSSPVILKRHRVAHCFPNRQTDMPFIVDVQPIVKPYECGKCDASFTTLDTLFGHQLCHTPEADSSLCLSNGINHEHEEPKEEQHFSIYNHHANSCQNISQSSASTLLTVVPPDANKTQSQQDISTSVLLNATTLPLSSSDTESTPSEMEMVMEPPCTSENTKKMQQTLSNATLSSKPEKKSGQLKCIECGACFAFLPALHRHYLDHARGEI